MGLVNSGKYYENQIINNTKWMQPKVSDDNDNNMFKVSDGKYGKVTGDTDIK